MMVLVVDDNANMRGLIRRILRDVAQEIRECSDGAQALTAYQTHQPGVVLMDMDMPQLDGLTATRQLMAQFPAARVVLLTQHSEEEMRAAAFAAGACGVACKEELTALPALLRQTVPAADSFPAHHSISTSTHKGELPQ